MASKVLRGETHQERGEKYGVKKQQFKELILRQQILNSLIRLSANFFQSAMSLKRSFPQPLTTIISYLIYNCN